jgi:hypothetical protein
MHYDPGWIATGDVPARQKADDAVIAATLAVDLYSSGIVISSVRVTPYLSQVPQVGELS